MTNLTKASTKKVNKSAESPVVVMKIQNANFEGGMDMKKVENVNIENIFNADENNNSNDSPPPQQPQQKSKCSIV